MFKAPLFQFLSVNRAEEVWRPASAAGAIGFVRPCDTFTAD